MFSDGVPADNIGVINPLDELCAHNEYIDPSAMYILNGTHMSYYLKKYFSDHTF